MEAQGYDKLVEALRHLSTGRCDDSRKCELCAIYETCLTRCVLDAADAIEELTGFLAESERDRDEYEERMEKEQDRVLALQAQLPKHGEWKPFDLTWGRSIYSCTVCGEAADVPTANGKVLYNYCPNCGAKMEVQDV